MMEATIGIFLARVFLWSDPELAARNTGLFFGYAGLVIIVVQGGLIGRLTRKVGEWPLAVLGPAMVAVGMGLYSWIAVDRALWLLLLAGLINAAGRSLQGPTVSSLLSKYSDPGEQGVVFGLFHGLSSLARVIGPIVAGLTYPYWRNTGQFWTAGAIAALAALWTLRMSRRAGEGVRQESEGSGAAGTAAVAQAARTGIE
jgi:DHA1 family tetracycline resistance protein-like MFS transporter